MFAIYVVSPIVTSGDSRFVIPETLSILRHGDANIDEYSHQFNEAPWAFRTENGHHWNVYPIGVPLLALPWVWVLDKTYELQGIDFEAKVRTRAPLFEELLIASLFTAAAATLLFRIARKQLSLPRAVFLGLAFAFGTSAYSSASRGLWQHGPAMMLLGIAVLLSQSFSERNTSWGGLALGAVAGFSYTVRPASLILIPGFAVLVAIANWRRLPPYFLGAALGVSPMLIYNKIAFGTWTSHYYRIIQAYMNLYPPRIKPALAVLVSPSRGLFIFSPFLLIALARLHPSLLRRRPLQPVEILLGSFFVAWWIAAGKSPWWWGGGSYGPRILTEAALCLGILMIPLLEDLLPGGSVRQRVVATALVAAVIFSVAVHFRAATAWTVWDWNATPVAIDQAPERVWDWSDPQFLRGLQTPPPRR